MLIKTSDKSLHYIVSGKVVWTRQESLTGAIKWQLGEGEKTQISQKESEKKHHMNMNLMSSFIHRLNSQFGSFKTWLTSAVKSVKELVAKKAKREIKPKIQDSKILFVCFYLISRFE